jgi:hypothetical protein
LKVYFGFLFLLALSPIKDLHIKLFYSTVVIEQQKPTLMQIIVLGKARLAAPEEHLPIAIILHLHLVWRTFT